VARRSAGRGARPPGSEQVRSGGCWGKARPAAHASGGEAVAALAPAGGQHGATGAGTHPQTEAMGLVPTTVVRLERALAQLVHSTQGACSTSPITGSGRAGQSPVASQLAPRTHATGLSWTCGTGRRRCRPANGTRCVATGSIRLSGWASGCNRGKTAVASGDAFHRHAEAWGYLCRYLWTTVDPPARQLLASVLPGKPSPRPIGLAGDQQADPHVKPLVRPRRRRRTTRKRCGTQREAHGRHHSSGNPQNRDILRYCTTCGQRCGVKGIQGSRTAAQPLKGSATGRGRITEQRRQPGK
jgi:hypothetical protein